MSKIDDAIAKITQEAMDINNDFAIFIEEYLTGICNEHIADKLLDQGKSLKDFVKRCENEARERARKQGSGAQCAGYPDQRYYEMVEEYYGITTEDKEKPAASKPADNVIDILDYMNL